MRKHMMATFRIPMLMSINNVYAKNVVPGALLIFPKVTSFSLKEGLAIFLNTLIDLFSNILHVLSKNLA